MQRVREYDSLVRDNAPRDASDSPVDRLSRLCRQLRLLTLDAQALGYSLEELILLDHELTKTRA